MTPQDIAKAALGIDWCDTESKARRVAEKAAELMAQKCAPQQRRPRGGSLERPEPHHLCMSHQDLLAWAQEMEQYADFVEAALHVQDAKLARAKIMDPRLNRTPEPSPRAETPPHSIRVHADGDANFYTLIKDGRWIARVQMNGEFWLEEQIAMVQRMAAVMGGD